jgi:polyisoprenoid-binding protein YceI
MTRTSCLPIVFGLAALIAFPAASQAPQKVDAAKSSIRFVTKQMGVPVEGRFRKFNASVAFDPKKPEATKAEFEVDLASIDLGSEEGETEVKRPLWFDTAKFPRAKFMLASLKPAGPGKYEASGALTIKGITQPIAVPVSFVESAGARTVEGQFTMKRLQFHIGEGHWSDTETVADEVLVRFRFALPSS